MMMMMMKSLIIFTTLCLISSSLISANQAPVAGVEKQVDSHQDKVVAAAAAAVKVENNNSVKSNRNGFTLSKLFHFKEFKNFFNKKYNSFTEEVRREKLFLARAFRAFISSISYKHHREDSYLAINHLSDRTATELDETLMKTEGNNSDDDEFFDAKSEFDADDDDDSDDSGNEQFFDAKSKFDDEDNEAEEVFFDALTDPFPLEGDESKRIKRETGEEIEEEKNKPASASYSPSSYFHNLPGASYLRSMYHPAAAGRLANYVPTSVSGSLKNIYNKASDLLLTQQQPRSSADQDSSILPDEISVDHRKRGCFTEPQQQGTKCGAGYLFATMGLYEYLNCIQSGNLIAFSTQYPLDCSTSRGGTYYHGLKGCQGGNAGGVSNFVEKHGFELAKSYPFIGKQDHCAYNQRRQPNYMGFFKPKSVQLKKISPDKIEFMHKLTPIFIILNVSDKFFEYGGGVDKGTNCVRRSSILSGTPRRKHAMLIVGSGREDNNEYWLIRNSYSVFWGEQGYYKLNKASTKHCIVKRQVYVPASIQKNNNQLVEENKQYNSGPVDFKYAGYIEADLDREDMKK